MALPSQQPGWKSEPDFTSKSEPDFASIASIAIDHEATLSSMREEVIPLLWAELNSMQKARRKDGESAFLAAGVGLAGMLALSKRKMRATRKRHK